MNKYLVKAAQIEKQSSFLAIAGGFHVGQNALMKKMITGKTVSNHISEGFATGLAGVKPTGIMNHAKSIAAGMLLPEVATMRQAAHNAGIAMRQKFPVMDNRTKAGLHLLSKGDVPRLQKMGLHTHPAVQHAAKEFDKHFGSNIHEALADKIKGSKIHEMFKGNDFPLLSNVVKHLPEGKLPTKVKPGVENINGGVAGAAMLAAVEPAAGVSNLSKTIIAHPMVQNNKYAKKVAHKLEHTFMVDPSKHAFKQGLPTTRWGRVKSKMDELFINPVAAQVKKTSAALGDISRSGTSIAGK